LARAASELAALRAEVGEMPPGRPQPHDLARLDWFDMRQMLLVAEAAVQAATARTESRGAHQREDFPGLDPHWTVNQVQLLRDGRLSLARSAVIAEAA
jgi:succinate dehydrogenase / fumarate reductase, flavoprotein subunit